MALGLLLALPAFVGSGVVVARTAVLTLVGLVVAWTTLSRSVQQFKKNQHRNVNEGVSLIKWIQSYRTPLLDRFFSAWTFFGEEEFYLLSLPWLFWNVEHKLGTQATLVVCVGIFSGNFLKDMFCIPRPPRDRVWVAPWLHAADSTGLRDYGFPSTHSLNAFSNPAFFVVYYLGAGALSLDRPLPLAAAVVAGTAYGLSLAVSRLYLGVHSPSDVRAGLFMGVILIATYGSVDEALYSWVTTADNVPAVLVLIGTFLLLMSPQVRPRTPTFLQNCTLIGLLIGDLAGSRFWHDRLLFDDVQSALSGVAVGPGGAAAVCALGWFGGGLVAALLRFVVGLAVVLACRAVGKAVMNTTLQAAFGVRLFAKSASKPEGGASDDYSALVVGLEAVSKTTVYTLLATGVTYGAPIVHHGLGIAQLAC